jgi:Kef-type K+ transport system membrane component KefB
MESYQFILDLAIILLCTKIAGLVTSRFKMPQVVGALLAGLILGPACLGILTETTFIEDTAEIGVIVLMFCAGLETDINEMKRSGKASVIIALIGVLVPLAGGFAVGWFFNQPGRIESDASASLMLQNIFIGVILTATSVSITVETLKELGKLKTKSGNAILGAAIIDDVIGIIALTIVISMADTSVNVGIVLLKIVLFFVFAAVVGYIFYKVYSKWSESAQRGMHRHTIVAFVFCLFLSFAAEQFFGVADITGAFLAGLVLSNTKRAEYIASKFDVISYLYLSPIFFASIGLTVVLPNMSGMLIAFSIVLAIVAIITKIVGCGLGAKMCGYKNHQCLQIGVGMISRGEVALIVASKGAAVGLLSDNILGPIIVVVVITTIITPILLKVVYKDPKVEAAEQEEPSLPSDEGFANRFNDVIRLREGEGDDDIFGMY